MSRKTSPQAFLRTNLRAVDGEYHLIGCSCEHCQPVPPPLPIAKLTIAGIFVGNVLAFIIQPVGAWSALHAAVAHLIGAR